MVRTLAEVNADRVRVTVELLDRPGDFDPGAAAEVLAENYARSRERVAELEDEVARLKLDQTRRDQADLSLSDRLYTAEEVGRFQADEAELVAAPLRARVAELEKQLDAEREKFDKAHVCTDRCKPNSHVAMIGREYVAELQRRINSLENRIVNLTDDRDRHARRVADLEAQLDRSISRENRLEADAAEYREISRGSIGARDRLLAEASIRIEKARHILADPAVTEIRDGIVTSKGAILADAIGRALEPLSPPAFEA